MRHGPLLSVRISLFLLQLALPTSLYFSPCSLQPWDGRALPDSNPTLRDAGTFFVVIPFLQSAFIVSRGCC